MDNIDDEKYKYFKNAYLDDLIRSILSASGLLIDKNIRI